MIPERFRGAWQRVSLSIDGGPWHEPARMVWVQGGTIRFRNRIEGWHPRPGPAPAHRVHVWVGGDMGPATSPNDPVFYLNHCNVDRVWAWMLRQGRTYMPVQSAPAELAGHRIDDPLFSLLTRQRITPADVLDLLARYTYDALS